MIKIITMSLMALTAIPLASPAQENSKTSKKIEFPLRAKYPKIIPISTSDLSKLDDPILVDARNRMEFDVIHMVSANNLLVGKMKSKKLAAIRSRDGSRPLVFYCNGVTCSKSYKASEKARIWGFKNIFVYDAGIFAWAKANPTRTRLFGKLVSAKDQTEKLLSKAELHKVCVDTATFIAKAKSGKYKVYDLRDSKERREHPIRLPKLARLSMDQFVVFLKKDKIQKSKILVLDNVGKQVRWLHYHLIKKGITDYAFLKGGVRQWQKDGFDAKGISSPATPGK